MTKLYDFFSLLLAYVFRPFYNFISSLGIPGNYILSIVIFSVLLRLVLMPSTIKQQNSMAKQARLQPKVNRIREKYKNYQGADKNQLIQQDTQALYQREGFSATAGGCLPLLIQLPVLAGLYGIIRKPLEYILQIDSDTIQAMKEPIKEIFEQSRGAVSYEQLYIIKNFETIKNAMEVPADIVSKIESLDFNILGINLGDIPKDISTGTVSKLIVLIPILAFISSALTGVVSIIRQRKTNPDAANLQMAGCTVLGMPLFSLFLTISFPAGMGVYWIISNVFAFFQTLIVGRTHSNGKLIAKMMVEETFVSRHEEESWKKVKQRNN